MRDDYLATLRRNMYSAANLDMSEQTAKPCSRIDQIEEICRQLDIDNWSVRPYANCITVSIQRWEDDTNRNGSLIARDYLIAIDNKDTLQDARSMIAKAAGIDIKRVMKEQHKPSDEAMQMFAKAMSPDEVDKALRVVGAATRQPTYKLQQPGGVWLDCMPDGSVRWRDGN